MGKPTVLHLIEKLQIGGAEVTVLKLVTHLCDGKYQPLVCTLTGGPLKAQIEDGGVPVITLNIGRRSIVLFPLFALDIIRILTELVRLVRRCKADIIHAHLPGCAILAGIVGKLSHAKVVASFPGPKLFPYDRSENDLRNYLRKTFYRVTGRLVDRFIAVSEGIGEVLCQTAWVEPRKIIVINSGVDVGEYEKPIDLGTAYADLGLAFNDIVIACVARFVPEKGHKVLLAAAQTVIQRHPNAKLLLVGLGPTMGDMKRLAVELNLEKHVKFLGYWPDLAPILASATAFVLPSFEEGISLALLEAMASGKPVVATDVPGNDAVVVSNKTGLLVPPGDAAALADAISYLISHPSIARKMGAKGRKRAESCFSFQKTVQSIEEIYDQLMREKQAGSSAR